MTMSIIETTLVVLSLVVVFALIRRVGLRQVMLSIGDAMLPLKSDIGSDPRR